MGKSKSESRLNNRRVKFCQNYVSLDNGTEAAKEAGFSPTSARTTASRLLSDDDVQDYISELREEQKERLIFTQVQVCNELYSLAMRASNDRIKIKALIAAANALRSLNRSK